MATTRSIVSLLSLLAEGRPLEFYDRVLTSFEQRTQEAPPPEPAVEEVLDWDSARRQLEEHYGSGVAAILEEPALREIEEQLGQRREEVSRDCPHLLALSADVTLARCCYLLCRLVQPAVALETGVAYGMTSAYILQALKQNGGGVLHSVDLPVSTTREAIGILVPPTLRGAWRLHIGASRRVLPKLLKDLGRVDLFVHDSLHTYWNMQREFSTVWPYLPAGGVLISDDAHRNPAFGELKTRDLQFWRMVQQTRKTYASFGVAIKGPA
jgi:predicted O-methyltransferase YrrM